MKRVVTSFLATVVALLALLDFKTHTPRVVQTAAQTTGTTGTTDTTTPTSVAAASDNRAAVSVTTTTTIKATTTASKTITGSAASTRWGDVQVQITVSGSKITNVNVIEYPQNNSRDLEINSYAIPELVSQTLSAQSANIDGVSGATVTTGGFVESLQSAISKI